MTHADRSGSHRSKKKRLALILAPVAAFAVAVPLMATAGAVTPSEVSDDCKNDSDKLESCQFIDTGYKVNQGPNERVSAVEDNCGSTFAVKKQITATTEVTRIMQTETGYQIDGHTDLGASGFGVSIKFLELGFNIKRDDKASGASWSYDATTNPNSWGFFMWSHKRLDVSGYTKATYKDPQQDGKTVFFSPYEKANSVHVFFPILLANGSPMGDVWFRNVKCTDRSGKPVDPPFSVQGGEQQREPGSQPEPGSQQEPGFGKGGPDVTDVKIPMSELSAGSGA